MDPSLGYKGLRCPTTNCYMRAANGACVASELKADKVSSRAMRDTIVVVEIIDAAKNAPEYAAFTPITSTGDVRYDSFIRESDITREQLQFVLDHNPVWAGLMTSLIRADEKDAA